MLNFKEMIMNKLYRIATVLSLVLAFASVKAQTVSPVDFMRMNPYQMKANPAADLPYESVMSILFGDIDLDVRNTTLRYDNLFEFNAEGRPTTINLRQFANSMKENNFLGLDANIDLFTLFRRIDNGMLKGMLTFNYGIKVQSDMDYNDGLFNFVGYGNSAFVGEDNPVKVNLDVNAQAYQEFAVGYQMKVTDQLSLGGRAKLLFGFANVTTEACEAQLYTDPDSYALRLRENVALKAGLPNVFYVDEGKLMTNGQFRVGDLFSNPGFGIDLAAEYRLDDRFSVVAAVRDLGFIRWNLNNIGFTSQLDDAGQFYDNGDFLFNGLSAEQWGNITTDNEYKEQFLDSLQQYFHLEFAPIEKYTTALNTSVLLRGNYDFDSHNRFSAQMSGRSYGSGFRPALTFAYNGYFYDMLDVCVTYTMMSNSYDNVGLGVSGRVSKTCNIYLTTNNIFGFFNPMNTSGMNVRLGMVFTLRPEDKNTEYE